MGYAVIMLLIVFLCHEVSSISILPHKHQIISLLKFKQSFTIHPSASYYCSKPYPKTSSWNTSRDCCSWDGVVCDDITGHVIELDLSCSYLTGTINSNSSLFQLSHLQRLNLSWNNFANSYISPEFGKFSSLKHLDLSKSYFSGQIPSEISHLSKLHSLRLSTYFDYKKLRLTTHDFKSLLQNLTQLRELDLSGINISSTIPLNFSSHLTTLRLSDTGLYGIIPESIFHLPNLETLYLGYNYKLNGYFPKTKWNSSASLIELNLSGVNFSCNLPESLGYYLTSVRYLSLQSCNLRGPIPESLSNLTRIEYLYLSYNSLNGTIPPGMLSLPSLKGIGLSFNHLSGPLEDFKSNSLISINLEGNQLQGHLPHSIQNLVNLTSLILSFNNFSGRVDVSLFSNLKQLSYLSLSYNNISLTNDNNVTLPESLSTLELAACEVKELEFLRSAKKLSWLDLSNNKIQGRIPDWAWSIWMFSLQDLNISHNMLTSVDSIPLQSLYSIDLRSNLLQGSLPIPSNSTRLFFISHNNLTGEISSSICNLTSLIMLDLATNNLRGEIPQCFGNITSLQVLDMRHNNLSGNIPTTFNNGSSLSSLNLHGNKLEGKIPQSLTNCKQLEVLDLGNNHLNDTFPVWLGTLPKLKILSLRFNKLHGPIRTSRIENMFPELRIIDLSYNAFSGNLPSSLFQHLKAMRTTGPSMEASRYGGDRYYQDSIAVVSKGFEREIVKILFLYTTIDLSNNKFEGHIPTIMGDLIALRVLNMSHNMLTSVDSIPLQFADTIDLRSNLLQGSLPIPAISTRYFFISHNNLTGEIPSSICKLTSLVMLDLATNNLRGAIPQCLGNITSLQVLDMRHNNLSGNIPTTFSTGSSLSSLNLHGNKLEGGIPPSLANCKELQVLDLGDNHLIGTFPMWLGTLPHLQVLSLRLNELNGPIRTSRIENMFPELRIIDLSYNAFSGNLPSSLFQHLKAMRTTDPSMEASRYGGDRYYEDSIDVVSKGYEREIVRILFLYTTIDLSNNKFEGLIPTIMGDLIALRVLNISHNRLEGHILSSLGSLSLVESLDLSSNHLVGEIPAQLASLTYLEVFNLSYNHLEGCIPQGNQFQTFGNNSYEGNDGLRGFPVTKSCGDDHASGTAVSGQLDGEESNFEFLSDFRKAALMGYGSGLCIGISIVYFMMSSGKPIWFARIIVGLEHKIMMRRRKKQRRQRNCRRRNNH